MSMKLFRYIVGPVLLLGLLFFSTAWADKLHEAVMRGDIARVNKLISQGVAINIKDDGGRTALYLAAQEGRLPLVEMLVAQRADINFISVNDDGSTPLIAAAYNGHYDVVDFLMSHGSNIDAKDADGYTALSWALKRLHFDSVKLLIIRGANVNVPPASDYGPPKGNDTLLHSAISRGDNEDLIKLLIDNGADVNAKEQRGATPLHFAVNIGRLETVKLLVESGAVVGAKASGGIYTGTGVLFYSGLTPLEVAELFEKHVPGPRSSIVELLRGHGDSGDDWSSEY